MNSEEPVPSEDVPDCFEMLAILKIYCNIETKIEYNRNAGSVERMVKRNAYGILMGKQEGKRLLSRPRHRYDGNIKMDINP